ncbi:transcriptional regulator SplA domain-containing protein [Alkalibacillus aidingensis]|uniref:transcriptional regulator SplA domain-containing protein n=1 Tax=Alkalibacillus aidingensis TaxID=2747607 RepID=UPI001660B0E3|nr:transcriptional regulator SplA domain-containing protein [Alkalibacillus aidingensis]
MYFEQNHNFKTGDEVYVLYRNPNDHDQARVFEGIVKEDPNQAEEMGVIFNNEFHSVDENIALFPTEIEAMRAFNYYFGEDGNLYS